MLFRFCKLCQRVERSAIVLQRFRSTQTLQKEEDNHQAMTSTEAKQENTRIITCKRSEFNFYLGQTYSKFEPIPLASRGWQHKEARGDYFVIHPLMEEIPLNEDVTFQKLKIDPRLLKKLEESNIASPTEIQKLAIPILETGCNTLISAETGCGKTLAFLLPLVQQILRWKKLIDRKPNTPLGLIITPSRELAMQIAAQVTTLTRGIDFRSKLLIGGRTKKLMLNPSVTDVDLLICTLGVMSKLSTNNIYKLQAVRHVILDEMDALFDETFVEKLIPFMRRIPLNSSGHADDITKYPAYSQLTLVSATLPPEVMDVVEKIVDPNSMQHVRTDKLHKILVTQKFKRVGKSQKPQELLKLVKQRSSCKQPTIVFSNDSATCDWISIFLKQFNVDNTHLNGRMPMVIREGKFAEFQKGMTHVLSTTNAGARGLDTTSVTHIINYDFPLNTVEYIHRCGRTGRIGSQNNCKITNFIARPLEIAVTQKIEKAARKMLPIPICDLTGTVLEKKKQIQPVPRPSQKRMRAVQPEKPVEKKKTVVVEDPSIPY
ncbi:probable ATP-dependent RNA helicase DDX28 [Cephus cinctus]|uniref:RNA helicase n=1 Tax=Cephus cinctus TaxID=211228 RepID=A0AAJ7BPY9_CEPCN|nr:probable ATP-dependent RNA helicase DDX28 [Cephus cinctus]